MPLRLAGGGAASGPINQEADLMTHFRRIQANQRKRAISVSAAVLILIGLTACATAPMSPSLVTLPGTGRSFDQFRADDYNCRLYGEVQIGLRTPQSAAAAAMTDGIRRSGWHVVGGLRRRRSGCWGRACGPASWRDPEQQFAGWNLLRCATAL
jgi:hypothetical protein